MSGISIRTFRNLLRNKALRAIGFTVAGLVALSMVVFFAYIPPMGLNSAQRGGTSTGGQVVLQVGDYKVTEGELEQYIQFIQQGREPDTISDQLSQRYNMLTLLGNQLALVAHLEKLGFRASDDEVEAVKQEYLKQQRDILRSQLLPNGKGSDRDLDRALKERGSSLRRFEEETLARVPEIMFRIEATQAKYTRSLREKYNPTDEQLRLMFENIFLSRIFISQEKHREKAPTRAQEAYNQLKAGKPFAEVVRLYSDDPGFITGRGGAIPGSDYYSIQDQLNTILRPEDVSGVLALKPGAFTPPLRDRENRGYYIFTLTKRQLQLPGDFEKEKAKYRDQFIAGRVQREQGRAYMQAMQAFKPQIKDPLLQQYEKWLGARVKRPDEQLKELEQIDKALTPLVASATPTTRMAQWLQIQVLASLRGLAKKTDAQKAKLYTERLLAALNGFFSDGGEDVSLRMMRAELLIELGQKAQALDDLEIAQRLAWRPDAFETLYRIADLYKKAGRIDLAQQTNQLADERKKQFDEMRKAQEEAIRRQLEAFRKQQEAQQKQQPAQQKQQETQQNQPAQQRQQR